MRINGELGERLGDGFAAAFISFSTGLAVLAAIVLSSPPSRRGVVAVLRALRRGSIPWWYVCGGAAGALMVLGQGLTAAVIGVALFSVAVVSGQTLASLAIDSRGIGLMTRRAVTPRRIVGSSIALLALVIAVSQEVQGDIPLWMLVLPFIAGIGVGWQQAVNGQVREVAQSALAAAFVNFAVGTTVLAVAFAVRAPFAGWPSGFPSEVWLYLGGPIAVIFIAGTAALVRKTGVLVLSLGAVAGQLAMSVVLDLVAPVAGQVLTTTTVLGAALALVGVVVAALPSRQRSEVTAPK